MLKTKYFLYLVACAINFINAATMEVDPGLGDVAAPTLSEIDRERGYDSVIAARIYDNIGRQDSWATNMATLGADKKAEVVSDIIAISRHMGWHTKSDVLLIEGFHNEVIDLINLAKPYAEGRVTPLMANEAQIRLRTLRCRYGGSTFYQRECQQIYDLFTRAVERGGAKICILQSAKLILEYDYSPTGDVAADEAIARELLTRFATPRAKASAPAVTEEATAVVPRSPAFLPHAFSRLAQSEHSRLYGVLLTKRRQREDAELAEITPATPPAVEALVDAQLQRGPRARKRDRVSALDDIDESSPARTPLVPAPRSPCLTDAQKAEINRIMSADRRISHERCAAEVGCTTGQIQKFISTEAPEFYRVRSHEQILADNERLARKIRANPHKGYKWYHTTPH